MELGLATVIAVVSLLMSVWGLRYSRQRGYVDDLESRVDRLEKDNAELKKKSEDCEIREANLQRNVWRLYQEIDELKGAK